MEESFIFEDFNYLNTFNEVRKKIVPKIRLLNVGTNGRIYKWFLFFCHHKQ